MIQVLVNEFLANVLFSEVAGSAKDLLELLGQVGEWALAESKSDERGKGPA